ncbi:MAG: hypothetical protein WCG83_07055 [Candidatus Peregrinibacteria bacterium]
MSTSETSLEGQARELYGQTLPTHPALSRTIFDIARSTQQALRLGYGADTQFLSIYRGLHGQIECVRNQIKDLSDSVGVAVDDFLTRTSGELGLKASEYRFNHGEIADSLLPLAAGTGPEKIDTPETRAA